MQALTLRYVLLFLLIGASACRTENERDSRGSRPVHPLEKPVNLEKVNLYLVKKSNRQIIGYIRRNRLDMQQTGTGLWYQVLTKGTGNKVQTGQMVTLAYRLSLLDGTLCYSSSEDGLKRFKTGQGGVETGLEEGVLLLHVGDSARLILPPHLAHGLVGDGNRIPARASLLYDIKVVDAALAD